MSIFSSYARFHWRLFNVLARVFGLMAVLFAVSSGVAGGYYIYSRAAEGIETAGLPASLLYFLVAVLCATIGIGVLRVRPYRPDAEPCPR